MLFPVSADWRTAPLSWLSGALPELRAGDQVHPGRWGNPYVLRLQCGACHQRYLAASPVSMQEPCPGCGGQLSRVGTWNMSKEAIPEWLACEVPG
jgi:hypothetical protein